MQTDNIFTDSYGRGVLFPSGSLVYPQPLRLAYLFYGFMGCSDVRISTASSSPYSTLDVATAARVMGIGQPWDYSPNTAIEILSAYSQLANSHPVSGPWDTDPAHVAYIGPSLRSKFRFVPCAQLNGQIAFILTKRGRISPTHLNLVVYDPRVVLFVHRAVLLVRGKIRDIVCALVKVGARFSLALHAPFKSRPNIAPRAPLPSFQASNYSHYIRLWTEFLRGPRGHVAIKAGGVIARLAVEMIHPRVVVEGSSQGVDLTVARLGAFGLFDTQLSDIDIAIVCGVHSSHEDSTELSSWWPTPDVWLGSCFDQGFWTPDAEQWFISLREWLDKEPPKRAPTRSEWRVALHDVSGRVHRLVENHHQQALNFILARI